MHYQPYTSLLVPKQDYLIWITAHNLNIAFKLSCIIKPGAATLLLLLLFTGEVVRLDPLILLCCLKAAVFTGEVDRHDPLILLASGRKIYSHIGFWVWNFQYFLFFCINNNWLNVNKKNIWEVNYESGIHIGSVFSIYVILNKFVFSWMVNSIITVINMLFAVMD